MLQIKLALGITFVLATLVFGVSSNSAFAQGAGLTKPSSIQYTAAAGAVTVSWTPGGNALGHLILWFNDDFSGEPKTGHPVGNTYTFNGITPGNYVAVVVAYDAAGAYVYELQLVHIAGTTVSLADRINALPWLADGVTEDERRTVNALRNILQEDPAVAETLLGFPWLADDITEYEWYAVGNLELVVREDPAVAKTILGFQWLADGVTEYESRAVHDFRYILRGDPAMAITLLSFQWLADSVTEEESRAVRDLRYILQEDPAMAETVLGSSWFSDGVTGTEMRTILGLSRLYGIDRSSLSTLTSKPWFKDGLSDEEFMLVGDLGILAGRSEADFLAIIDMPFLETLELADVLAVHSLRQLAYCTDVQTAHYLECSENEPDEARVSKKFRQAMSHPTISDGISNEEAKIVATLYGARFYNPDIFDPLLDPNTVTLEERTIDLPHTGDTQLTIIRIRPGAERTMDFLERAVRTVEGFVAMPFPVRHVIFLAEDTYHGAGITWSNISGRHEIFDTDESSEVKAVHIMAHEASHYYWYVQWTLHWVEDGLGAFFQSFIVQQANVGPGESVVPIWPAKVPPCPITSNIAELERLHRDEDVKTDCSDSLGDRLFQDLWRNLGESVFRQGLANLYLAARSGSPVGGCEFAKAGMCRVEVAFKAAAPAEAAATVDQVLDRWYYNSEPYDLSHVDASPANPKLPGDVEITRAYISLDRDSPEATRTDSFSAGEVGDEVFLNLHFSLPSSWQTQKLPLTFVTYFEDGFAFRNRTITRTFHAGRSQVTLPYSIDVRTGTTWIVKGNLEPPPRWATGRYWVSVYHGEQKVAEVEFEVTP